MTDLFPPTREDVAAEIRRELGQRAHVYPRLVAAGKLTQERADRQTALMQEALRIVEGSDA